MYSNHFLAIKTVDEVGVDEVGEDEMGSTRSGNKPFMNTIVEK